MIPEKLLYENNVEYKLCNIINRSHQKEVVETPNKLPYY